MTKDWDNPDAKRAYMKKVENNPLPPKTLAETNAAQDKLFCNLLLAPFRLLGAVLRGVKEHWLALFLIGVLLALLTA